MAEDGSVNFEGDKWPPLFGAVAFQDLPAVKEALLQPNSWQPRELTAALHMAAVAGCAGAVPLLVHAGASLDDASLLWGDNFVHKLNLEPQGVDVSELQARVMRLRQLRALTPLEQAAALGHTSIVQQMLAVGARLGSAHLLALRLLLDAEGSVTRVVKATHTLSAILTGTEAAAAAAAAASTQPGGEAASAASAAAAAAAGQWDAGALSCALRALLADWPAFGNPRHMLRTLMMVHDRDEFIDPRHGPTLVKALLAVSDPEAEHRFVLRSLPLTQLWAAAPALRPLPLLQLVFATSRLKDGEPVMSWLLSRKPAQAALREEAEWEQFWNREYQKWRQLGPAVRPPPASLTRHLPTFSSNLLAGLAVHAASDAATWLKSFEAAVAAGLPITIHAYVSIIVHHDQSRHIPGAALRRLLSAAGRQLPPMPLQHADWVWDPVYRCLQSHLKRQGKVPPDDVAGQRACHARCLALLEEVLSLGFRPTPLFTSLILPDGGLLHNYRPLEGAPEVWDVGGKNRWLWLAAQQLPWSPHTHAQFPPALRAAARTLLLIANRRRISVQHDNLPNYSRVVNSAFREPPLLNRLPSELLHRILGVAAYPLSAWSPQLPEAPAA